VLQKLGQKIGALTERGQKPLQPIVIPQEAAQNTALHDLKAKYNAMYDYNIFNFHYLIFLYGRKQNTTGLSLDE